MELNHDDMSEVNDIYATARSAEEAMDTLIARSVSARNQQIKADAMRHFRAGNSPSESVRLAFAQESLANAQQKVRHHSPRARLKAITPPFLGTVIPALLLLFLDSHHLIQPYFRPFSGQYTNFALMDYPIVLGVVLGFLFRKNAIKGALAGLGFMYFLWIGLTILGTPDIYLTVNSVYTAVILGWITWPATLTAGIVIGKLGRNIWNRYIVHSDH